MHYDNIIFDFDGTLADTENQVLTIYNALAEKYDYKRITKEELHSIKLLNFMDVVKHIDIPYSKIPKIIKEGQHMLKEQISSIKPFQPNIKEILCEIREMVDIMGIITSNTRKNVKNFIINNELDLFDFVESSSFHGKEKKINKVCKKYELVKEKTVYVGDEKRDIDACKRAKIDCIAVSWGYNYPEILLQNRPNYMVNSLEGIIDILK